MPDAGTADVSVEMRDTGETSICALRSWRSPVRRRDDLLTLWWEHRVCCVRGWPCDDIGAHSNDRVMS